jgi:hypothetical protein
MLQDLLDVETDASDVLLEAVLQIVAQVLTSSLRALLVQKYKNRHLHLSTSSQEGQHSAYFQLASSVATYAVDKVTYAGVC